MSLLAVLLILLVTYGIAWAMAELLWRWYAHRSAKGSVTVADAAVVHPARFPRISLLVPFHTDHAQRAENWDWLARYWRAQLPGAEIIVEDDHHVPFCKTAAVNRAFKRSTGDIIVILDADAYLSATTIKHLADEIRTARREGRRLWYVPYRRFYRLSAMATRALIKSAPDDPMEFWDPPLPGQYSQDNSPSSGHWWGALCQIMPREAFHAIRGMDERFAGWGGEDISFLQAVDTLWARHRTFDGAIYHLWHPTIRGAWRATRQWAGQEGPELNEGLTARYRSANGDPARMRRLIGEEGSGDL